MTQDQEHQVIHDTIRILETGLTKIGPAAAMLAAIAVLEKAVREIEAGGEPELEEAPGGWRYKWVWKKDPENCSWIGPFASREGALAGYQRRVMAEKALADRPAKAE